MRLGKGDAAFVTVTDAALLRRRGIRLAGCRRRAAVASTLGRTAVAGRTVAAAVDGPAGSLLEVAGSFGDALARLQC